MKTSSATDQRPVTFVGPLPPPVTGMTAMSEVIVNALRQAGPVKCYNWSPNRPVSGLRWKMIRAWGVVKSYCGLLLAGRRRSDVFYYPANSSWGLLYDLALTSLARLLGYTVVLHHHAYSYIDQFDRRMSWLNRIVGPKGRHAVHCQKMADDFQRQYASEAPFLIVPPTIVSHNQAKATAVVDQAFDGQRPLVIGFLSNLTLAKGLATVLAVFEELLRVGANVRLVLAGPCLQSEARALVDAALANWGERIDYRGPVYQEEKSRFFADIDAFVFPTQYKNESWGIVLTEAMACGVPVIANDRGCVSHIVQNGCGRVVAGDEQFVPVAVELIQQWMDEPALLAQASRRAVQRTAELEQAAAEELPDFINQLTHFDKAQPC